MKIEDTNELQAAFEDVGKEAARDAMDVWFEASQDRLTQANSQRSGIDSARDQRGTLQGRRDNDLHVLAQSAQPPQWDGDSWVFVYTHFAAKFHEWGVEPHDIEASGNGVLAFKWPDAPPEVIAMFTPGGEDEVNRSEWDGWVYFKTVNHPGVPAIGFTRHGRNRAEQYLIDSGVSK